MQKLAIKGGRKLSGTIMISGSKNATLPILASTILTNKKVTITNVPIVKDVETMVNLLKSIGSKIKLDKKEKIVEVLNNNIVKTFAPYNLLKTMRAGVLVLGSLLGKYRVAKVSLPGGCAWGPRPIDYHLTAFETLGAKVTLRSGYIVTKGNLKAHVIKFPQPSVGATGNIIMAACQAEGISEIFNAACEPEVINLANMLRSMGALIEGDGTKTIRINGVSNLNGADHTIIPDRIEAGTFMIAGAITGGEIELIGCQPCHLSTVINTMRQAGVIVEETERDSCVIRAPHEIQACNIITKEYPGFATDMQAQFMALMTQAHGTSFITETIFESRFLHASEMIRMGANIKIEGNQATIFGKTNLTGANVIASDLRASASLVLAGLVATGETIIDRVYHLDRGYERIEHKLKTLGAKIIRGSK